MSKVDVGVSQRKRAAAAGGKVALLCNWRDFHYCLPRVLRLPAKEKSGCERGRLRSGNGIVY